MSEKKTLFQKIIDGEIPSDFVYKDDICVAFRDINPKAPVHILIVPLKPIPSIMELTPKDSEMVSHLIYTAKKLAEDEACKGYRLQFNVGEKGGQIIFHLHLHLMGWR